VEFMSFKTHEIQFMRAADLGRLATIQCDGTPYARISVRSIGNSPLPPTAAMYLRMRVRCSTIGTELSTLEPSSKASLSPRCACR
jgi:hypothetical protein